MRHKGRALRALGIGVCVALWVGGCESLQRKFTRKPSSLKPQTPIIQFQDYTRSMTPVDRYRKHAMLFDYWNSDLLETLQGRLFNAKRARRASSESLLELRELQDLLMDESAQRLSPIIAERQRIDQQIQAGAVVPPQALGAVQQLEAQTRAVHRDFYWRDVQDQLKAMEPAAAAAPAASESAPATGRIPVTDAATH